MEFITILLSGLLGLLSPVGIALDTVANNLIRDRLTHTEDLAVRIDNAPTHQLLQGRVDRVRIAGRGLFPAEGVRIDVLEIETEAIAANPNQLRNGQVRLERPLNAGVKLVLTEADLNRALQSSFATERLRNLSFNLFGTQLRPVNPQITLLGGNRLRVQATFRPANLPISRAALTDQWIDSSGAKAIDWEDGLAIAPSNPQINAQVNDLQVTLETGITVVNRKQVQLLQPVVIINGQQLPLELLLAQSPTLRQVFEGINQSLDLQNFESSGILARILELKIEDDAVHLASFVQVKPEALGQ